MTELERIDKLEKFYEDLYHTYELLSIYIPRLVDILEAYWEANERFRHEVLNDMNGIRSFLKLNDKEMQEHFKIHNLDKKIKPQVKYEGIEIGNKKRD